MSEEARPEMAWAVCYRERFAADGPWCVAAFTVARTRREAVRRWDRLGAPDYARRRKRGVLKAMRVRIEVVP